MNKIVTMAMLFTGISLATFAQQNNALTDTTTHRNRHHRHGRFVENKKPDEIAKIKTERLNKELKFTDEQRAQVYALQLKDANKSAEYRDQMKAVRDSHRQEMKGSHDELQEILSVEQKQILNDKFKTHKKRKIMHHRDKRTDVTGKDTSKREIIPVEKQ